MNSPWKLGLGFLVAFSAAYLGSYVVLSALGHYALALSPAGKKVAQWAPLGFVQRPTGPISSAYDFKWNRTVMVFYGPLYRLDGQFWHPVKTSFPAALD